MPDDRAVALSALEPAVRTAVLGFNLLPVHYIDRGRLAADHPDLAAAVWQRLVACPRLAWSLSRWLLERYELSQSFCFDFAAPMRRLALLSAAQLEQVAIFAGLLLHAEAISRVVARAKLEAIISVIGEDGRTFAVKRAAFLRLPVKRPRTDDLGAAVRRDGLSCLAAWLDEEPAPVRRRVLLKFPPGSPVEAPEPELAGAAGRWVLARVLREGVAPWPVSSA